MKIRTNQNSFQCKPLNKHHQLIQIWNANRRNHKNAMHSWANRREAPSSKGKTGEKATKSSETASVAQFTGNTLEHEPSLQIQQKQNRWSHAEKMFQAVSKTNRSEYSD